MIRIILLALTLVCVTCGPAVYSQTYYVGVPAILNNPTATVNPTVNNDSSQGYSMGSLWQNTSTGQVFMAKSVAVGAAVWTALN